MKIKIIILTFLLCLGYKLNAAEVQASCEINGVTYDLWGQQGGYWYCTVRSGNTNLTSVTIPQKVNFVSKYYTGTYNVDIINSNAFKDCTKLEEVIIEKNTITIGAGAFKGCTKLKKVVLGDGVSISSSGSQFSGCKSLKSIILPKSVQSLANTTFENCSSELKIAYTTNLNNTSLNYISSYALIKYSTSDKVTDDLIYSSNNSIIYYADANLKQIDLPKALLEIGDFAFAYCSDIKNIDIPQSVNKIGSNAFDGCTGLTSVTFPETLNTIGANAFDGCTGLLEVNIPGSTTSIGEDAFKGTTSLKHVYLERGNGDLSVSSPFTSSGVEYLFLGRNISGFLGMEASLTDVEIGPDVISLPANCFSGYSKLGNVIMPDPRFSVSKLTTIGNNAFLNCSSLPSIAFQDNVQSIGSAAFKGCSALQSVILPVQLTEIAAETFSGCTSLQDITLPNGTAAIGVSAFYNCQSLPTINIPDGVTAINENTFQNCYALNKITLPGKLSSIGNYAFEGCKALSELKIPNSVETLGTYSFRNCSALAGIELSSKLTNISDYAFQGCAALPAVVIPDEVTSIGNYAFDSCSALTEVQTSPVLQTLGTNAFYNCDLKEIMLPATVSNIGANAFNGNDELIEVYTLNTTPPSCTSANAFSDNTKQNAKLYLPRDSYYDYVSSFCWKDFTRANIEPLTVISSIEIKAPANRLRINKTMAMTAVVAPDDTQFTNVIWNSSNPAVATVEDDGTVTAHSPGYTVISAKSTSLFAVQGLFELQVIDFLIGDSNESDYVTITDAVNIASFVMGKKPQVFNFEASDVNESGDITLADASGVITIVLNETGEDTAEQMIRKTPAAYSDRLVAEDFSIAETGKTNVPVYLTSYNEFVALQADVRATGGLHITDITPSDALASTHLMQTKRLGDDAMRVVIYSPALNAMPSDPQSLFNVEVTGSDDSNVTLEITNILATDSALDEYRLGFEGGNNQNVSTGIIDLNTETFSIEAGIGMLSVKGAEGSAIRIFSTNGSLAALTQCAAETESFRLASGLYIVTIDEKAVKVIVR